MPYSWCQECSVTLSQTPNSSGISRLTCRSPTRKPNSMVLLNIESYRVASLAYIFTNVQMRGIYVREPVHCRLVCSISKTCSKTPAPRTRQKETRRTRTLLLFRLLSQERQRPKHRLNPTFQPSTPSTNLLLLDLSS